VVFNANIPEGVTAKVTGLHAANSGFIYGQDLPTLDPATAPKLDDYVFQGYYDSPETGKGKQYYSSTLERQNVFDTGNDGNPDAPKWDKTGPAQTLYAQWIKPFWTQSNIYFKPDEEGGVVGSLTFSETDASKSGYQGLYFKWGSLIGVAPGEVGDILTGDTYLYIPEVSTGQNSGKYYKVQAGDVNDSYDLGTTAMNDAVKAFARIFTSIAWSNIPYVTENLGNHGSSYSPLTDGASDQAHTESYKGDICKFLSDKKSSNDSGLKKSWVMPKSDDFSALAFDKMISYAGNVSNIEDGCKKMDANVYLLGGLEIIVLPSQTGRMYLPYGVEYVVTGTDNGMYWTSSTYMANRAIYRQTNVSGLYGPFFGDDACGCVVRCVRMR
jgi:hypothetical protein